MEFNQRAANKTPFANTSLLKTWPMVITSVDPANITSCSPQIPPDPKRKTYIPSFLIPLLALSKTAFSNFWSLCLAMFWPI